MSPSSQLGLMLSPNPPGTACSWSNVVTIKRKKEQLPPITVSLSLPDHDDKVSGDGYHGDGDDEAGDDNSLLKAGTEY